MKKTKYFWRILREAVLILLVLIIASGIGYQYRKTPGERENDIKYLRAVLFSKGIYIKYKLPEKEMDGMVLWDSANQESNKEKKLVEEHVDFVYMNYEQAIKIADKIFCGKVQSRSTATKGLPIYNADGSIYGFDHYRELTVEVTDVIKGTKSREEILYKEPGGETEEFIYKWYAIEPLTIGQEYLFFLYENNTFLNPIAIMPISDGQVLVQDIMCPENLQVEEEKVSKQSLPVGTYMNAVKISYWSALALTGLLVVVGIGIVLASCYFVCRNLYKTTIYIVKYVRKF